MKTIRISTARQRLADDLGITYYRQSGGIIRSAWSKIMKVNFLRELHHSVESEDQAVAAEAYRVLAEDEQIAAKWRRD